MAAGTPIAREETLGVGVNRRRITPIGGPSLVRHLAIWLPSGQDDDSSQRRTEAFDEIVASVYIAIRKSFITGVEFETNSWASDRRSVSLFSTSIGAFDPYDRGKLSDAQLHRAIKFKFAYRHVPLVLDFDLHEEIGTITFILDCSSRLSADDRIGDFPDELREVFNLLERRARRHSGDAISISNSLYFEFWSEIDELLFSGTSGLDDIDILLDARGIILAAESAGDTPDKVNLIRPFSQLKTTDTTAAAKVSLDTIALKAARISELIPLITCRMDNTTEYTLSHMMGYRALYASCLGSGPDNISSAVVKPITFLLLADPHNSWQLGRLIYRIHRAATARLAATKYFLKLRERAQLLGAVERSLEEALSKTSSATAALKDDVENARNAALTAYQKIERELDTILDYGKHEALVYRINRSRYYVRQFHRAVEALRIERVEGFQPYNEYVEQRQGSAFEFLDLLGRRYARLQSDRSLLLRRIQVFNAQINEDEISLAQWTADAALFIVLGPYYAAHVLVEISFNWIGGEHGLGARLLWFGCLIIGIACFSLRQAATHAANEANVKRSRWRKLRHWRPSRRLLTAWVLVLATVCAFYFLARIFPGHSPSGEASAGQQNVLE